MSTNYLNLRKNYIRGEDPNRILITILKNLIRLLEPDAEMN